MTGDMASGKPGNALRAPQTFGQCVAPGECEAKPWRCIVLIRNAQCQKVSLQAGEFRCRGRFHCKACCRAPCNESATAKFLPGGDPRMLVNVANRVCRTV